METTSAVPQNLEDVLKLDREADMRFAKMSAVCALKEYLNEGRSSVWDRLLKEEASFP